MINKEEIGYKLGMLLDIVGEDRFLEITKQFGGDNVYIPTHKSVLRSARNKEIIEKYNGVNAKELAKEYDVCVTHVNRILNNKMKDR